VLQGDSRRAMTNMGPFRRIGDPKKLSAACHPIEEEPFVFDHSDSDIPTDSRRYELSWLRAKCSQLPRATTFGHKSSRGYISLMNLVREMHESRPTSPPAIQRNSRGVVSLVEANPDRFLPTAMEKNIGLWDTSSEKAFRLTVLSLLNRLTVSNLNDTIAQMASHLTGPDRIKFVADSLTEKAAHEHAFAQLYASFTRSCVDPRLVPLRDQIIGQISNEFYIWCANRTRTEPESHIAIGCAKFYGALVAAGMIELTNSAKAFEILLKNIESGISEGIVSPHIIEMFLFFLKEGGPTFARQIPAELWIRFDSVLAAKALSPRLMCLLTDADEIKQEYVLGKKRMRAQCQPLPPRNEAAINSVRNEFENYKEGGDPVISLAPNEFVRAAADLFPDHLRDSVTYCEFICDVLQCLRVPSGDIVDTLGQVSEEFLQEKVQCDSPKFWSHFDDLLYLMMLRRILGTHQVATVWKRFPKEHATDVVNGMKWYLSDHHYFTRPIDLDRFPSDEVRDALRMPATIEQPLSLPIPISRLIAVAIVRSVAAKVAEAREVNIDSLSRWSDYLKLVLNKQRRVFVEELEFVISDYDFPFTQEDVVAMCSP
jgi:hypothetical protein